MINLWLIAAGVLVAAGAAALARRTRSSESSSLAPRDTAVPPVSSEWLSNARGKQEES
jgi:hypothetical protein